MHSQTNNRGPGDVVRDSSVRIFDDAVICPGDGRRGSRRDGPGKPPPARAPGPSETIKLFDGKSLIGWAGHFKHWSVDDGEIVGKNTEPVPVSTYLLTEKNYTDFRLTAKVKLVQSEMHSGIAFWGRDATEKRGPGDLRRAPGDVPVGLGHVRPLRPEQLCESTRRRPKRSASNTTGTTWRSWRRATASGSLSTASPVVDWSDPEPNRIKAGPIGLQLHSNKVPQEVRFKDLGIKTFPKDQRLITVK